MRPILFLLLVLTSAFAGPEEYTTGNDLPYTAGTDPYRQERCKLDLYHPSGKSGFATVVWFHGGGLRGGKKNIPKALQNQGFAVAAANYRLHPEVTCPAYIEDAAAAVAWVFKNIGDYGGDPTKIFVSGHSAGGYLTSMVGLDKSYLAAHDIDTNEIRGLVPLSGNCVTHFTVREENGVPREQPVIDRFAPLFHVRRDAPPIVLVTGGRDRELLGRYEENAYLWRMLKVVKHPNCTLYELDGFDHGGMLAPGLALLLDHVKKSLSAPAPE